MSDYINRQAAFEALEKRGVSTTNISRVPIADVVEVDKAQKEIDYWHDKAQSYEQTILKLSLNKADVVEVVKCKDCKHYNTYENNEKINDGDKLYDGWCMRWSGIEDMNDNDFCSYGERADT